MISRRKVDCLLLVAVLQMACAGARPEPVEIALNEQSCSHCRMAVSQRLFAGEVVRASGSVHYFDDIGCLADWIGRHPVREIDSIYVTDYETGLWLEAATAHYLRSEILPTPMGSGLAAFATAEQAVFAAGRLSGQQMTWAEVLIKP